MLKKKTVPKIPLTGRSNKVPAPKTLQKHNKEAIDRIPYFINTKAITPKTTNPKPNALKNNIVKVIETKIISPKIVNRKIVNPKDTKVMNPKPIAQIPKPKFFQRSKLNLHSKCASAPVLALGFRARETPVEPMPNTIAEAIRRALPGIEIRIQKVLGTYTDLSDSKKIPNKSLPDPPLSNPTKILVTQEDDPVAMDIKTLVMETDKSMALINDKPRIQDKMIDHGLLKNRSNVYRAIYAPPFPPEAVLELPDSEPSPRCEAVNCLLQQVSNFTEPLPVGMLAMWHSPVKCPDSSCEEFLTMSAFGKHFYFEHENVPLERVRKHQCKNFFIDANLVQSGAKKIQMVYMLRDTITGIGEGPSTDLMPLMVLTSRIKLRDLYEGGNELDTTTIFMVWVCTLKSEAVPISVSLTAWSSFRNSPRYSIVKSCGIWDIRDPGDLVHIFRSGRALLLTPAHLKQLSNDSKQLIKMQLIVD